MIFYLLLIGALVAVDAVLLVAMIRHDGLPDRGRKLPPPRSHPADVFETHSYTHDRPGPTGSEPVAR